MSATLGGLVKDYRLQKNLSQLEISFALGWKEPSRLSRIEQGRVGKPPRKLMDKIIKAMKLTEEEKNHLLLVGNYLPTEEEIEGIRKETDPIIKNWPYSIIVYDYTWRIIHYNKIIKHLYKIDGTTEKYVKKNHTWLLEVIFNDTFTQNADLNSVTFKEWRKFLRRFLIRYRYAQRVRTKEKWYQDLVTRLMNMKLFREIWTEIQNEDQISIGNFGTIKSIINPDDPKKMLNVHFFVVPLLKDPRFEIQFDTPADIETYEYFHKLEKKGSFLKKLDIVYQQV